MRACSSSGNARQMPLVIELLVGHFVGPASIETAHVELGRRVEPEELRAADMAPAQLRGPGHLHLPIVLVRVHRPPVVGLLHLKLGEFRPVVSLDVLVGGAAERLVKRAKGGLPGYTNDAANFVKRDAAQPERDDMLLTPGRSGTLAHVLIIDAVKKPSICKDAKALFDQLSA